MRHGAKGHAARFIGITLLSVSIAVHSWIRRSLGQRRVFKFPGVDPSTSAQRVLVGRRDSGIHSVMKTTVGRVQRGLAGIVMLALCSLTLGAQQGIAPPAPGPAQHTSDAPPPLPAAAHVDEVINVGGKPLKYTVTVEALPVYGAGDKKIGEVVFTVYTVGQGDRPVTFAINGGPGAAPSS